MNCLVPVSVHSASERNRRDVHFIDDCPLSGKSDRSLPSMWLRGGVEIGSKTRSFFCLENLSFFGSEGCLSCFDLFRNRIYCFFPLSVLSFTLRKKSALENFVWILNKFEFLKCSQVWDTTRVTRVLCTLKISGRFEEVSSLPNGIAMLDGEDEERERLDGANQILRVCILYVHFLLILDMYIWGIDVSFSSFLGLWEDTNVNTLW